MHKRFATVVASATLAACSGGRESVAPVVLPPAEVAPASVVGQVVPNEYIVVMRKGAAGTLAQAERAVIASGGVVTARWSRVLVGFAARLTPRALADLRRRTDVAQIVPDARITKSTVVASTVSSTVSRTVSNAPAANGVAAVGSWGLDRVDQRVLPLNNSYAPPADGAGVHVYVLDSGINAQHQEFTGRVGAGANFAGGTTGTDDCNGHGTHVSATIVGTRYGVARRAVVHPVRVLDCYGNGQWSWLISGVDWIVANAVKPAVANASLNGGAYAVADSVIRLLTADGIALAVSSGNSAADACNESPARTGVTAGIITTNASAVDDSRYALSNFGPCTDLYAPGVGITSAWIGGNAVTLILSGTSMAAPHAAGAAALQLSLDPLLTPAQVEAALRRAATTNSIGANPSLTPNMLLYVGQRSAPPPGNAPPVASFQLTGCRVNSDGFHRCDFDASSSTDDAGIVSYEWSAPNLPDKTGVTIRYIFQTRGTYPVTLTVTDAQGATSTVTRMVQIE